MNNKASVIKLQKTVKTKIELAKTVILLLLGFNEKKLSNTEITVLAYFMVYGVNSSSKALIVKSEICKNIANIKTIMVKLKKMGLIYKDDFNGKVYVAKALSFEITPSVVLYLKLDQIP